MTQRILIELGPPDANGARSVNVQTELPPNIAVAVLEDAKRALTQPAKPTGIEIATPAMAKQLLAAR